MEEISALAAAETIAVLNKTDLTMVAQIPYKLIKGFEDKAEEYDGKIELKENTSLLEQPISEEARSLLLILYREYWSDEAEKEEIDNNLIESEKEFTREESERLDPFKDSKIDSSSSEISTIETPDNEISSNKEENESTSLIEIHKKWYIRIFDRIIRFFRKK